MTTRKRKVKAECSGRYDIRGRGPSPVWILPRTAIDAARKEGK